MIQLSSGSPRLMSVFISLVMLFTLGIAVSGCSDSSPTNSTAQHQSDNSGVIRGGMSPGDVDFEYRVTATSQPAGAIGGPFAIRGRNIRYEAGAVVVDLSVVNLGTETHAEPISLTFLSLLPSGVTISNPDAAEQGAGAMINFVFDDGDGMWAPNEESMGRPTNFVIASGMAIGFVAQLNGSANGMGAIGGMVWNDANGDGVMDTTEAPVEGATIMLDADGVSRTTASGPDGLYRFDSLTAGFYTVQKTADSGMTITTGNPIFITLVDTGGVVSSFLAANFGCQIVGGDSLSGSINGTVFNDANANGILDSGEVGVPGAEVMLSGSDSLYAGYHAVVLTDTLGHYVFTLTDSAMYMVILTPMAGFTSTTPDSVSVTAGGSADVVVDFGVTGGGSDSSALCVSGHAFDDLNHNKAFDEDEPGLNGVVIRLYLWQAEGSEPVPTPFGRDYLSAKTDEEGAYLFENLEAGIYVVLSKKPREYDRTTWVWGIADVGGGEGGCAEVNFGFISHDEDDCGDRGEGKGHDKGRGNGHGDSNGNGHDRDNDDDDDDDDNDDDGGRGDIARALRSSGITK